MERISIFNYEAFYLDYLEGNLSKEDTQLLMEFLRKNPDLELMEEDLPTLDQSFAALSSEDKNALKQTDETDAITLENAQHFLIAEAEGLLSENKIKELDSFVLAHPALERDREIFAAVYLQPDMNLIYADKAGLKQDRKIVFWPYIAGIAAAGLIAAVFIFGNGEGNQQQLAEKEQQKELLKELKQNDNQTPVQQLENDFQMASTEKEASQQRQITYTAGVVQKENSKQDEIVEIQKLPKRSVRPIVPSLNAYDLGTVTPKIVDPKIEQPMEDNTTLAYRGMEEMKNPIRPLTEAINDRFGNDKVDFRTAKPTQQKNGGFYLKLGKLEILRKSGKKN